MDYHPNRDCGFTLSRCKTTGTHMRRCYKALEIKKNEKCLNSSEDRLNWSTQMRGDPDIVVINNPKAAEGTSFASPALLGFIEKNLADLKAITGASVEWL